MRLHRIKRSLAVFFVCIGILIGMTGTVHAEDVYVTDVEDMEVYIDTNAIMGSRAQFMIVNGVKFVADGRERNFATAKFYIRGGIWWGNIAIGNIPSQGDYPAHYDDLTMAILNVALQYI